MCQVSKIFFILKEPCTFFTSAATTTQVHASIISLLNFCNSCWMHLSTYILASFFNSFFKIATEWIFKNAFLIIAFQCIKYFKSFSLTFKIKSQIFNMKKLIKSLLTLIPSSPITLPAFDVPARLALFQLLNLLSFFPPQVFGTCCCFAWNVLPLLLYLILFILHNSD